MTYEGFFGGLLSGSTISEPVSPAVTRMGRWVAGTTVG